MSIEKIKALLPASKEPGNWQARLDLCDAIMDLRNQLGYASMIQAIGELICITDVKEYIGLAKHFTHDARVTLFKQNAQLTSPRSLMRLVRAPAPEKILIIDHARRPGGFKQYFVHFPKPMHQKLLCEHLPTNPTRVPAQSLNSWGYIRKSIDLGLFGTQHDYLAKPTNPKAPPLHWAHAWLDPKSALGKKEINNAFIDHESDTWLAFVEENKGRLLSSICNVDQDYFDYRQRLRQEKAHAIQAEKQESLTKALAPGEMPITMYGRVIYPDLANRYTFIEARTAAWYFERAWGWIAKTRPPNKKVEIIELRHFMNDLDTFVFKHGDLPESIMLAIREIFYGYEANPDGICNHPKYLKIA